MNRGEIIVRHVKVNGEHFHRVKVFENRGKNRQLQRVVRYLPIGESFRLWQVYIPRLLRLGFVLNPYFGCTPK